MIETRTFETNGLAIRYARKQREMGGLCSIKKIASRRKNRVGTWVATEKYEVSVLRCSR